MRKKSIIYQYNIFVIAEGIRFSSIEIFFLKPNKLKNY